jgi:uncharacterized membrane protein YbhN (UPF0104 family)
LVIMGEVLWRLQGRPVVVARPVAQAAALVNLSLGQILPASPVEGFTFSFLELRRRGLPGRRAGLALAWGQWLQARAIVLLAGASAIAVLAYGELTGHLATLTLLGIGGAALFLAGTWALTRRPEPAATVCGVVARMLPIKLTPKQARRRAHRLHTEAQVLMGRGRQRLVSTFMAALPPLATGLCLWLVLVGGHHPVSVEEVLLASAVATLASWVPFLPGGIGVAETTLTAVLHHFGVPVPQALAAALLWRALTLLAPAASGFVALVGLRLRRVPAHLAPAVAAPSDHSGTAGIA